MRLQSISLIFTAMALSACASIPDYVPPTQGEMAQVRFQTGKVKDGTAGVWGTAELMMYKVSDAQCGEVMEIGRLSTAPINLTRPQSLDMPLAEGRATSRYEVRMPAAEEIFLVVQSTASAPSALGSTGLSVSYLVKANLVPNGLYEVVLEKDSVRQADVTFNQLVPVGSGFERKSSDAFSVIPYTTGCKDI